MCLLSIEPKTKKNTRDHLLIKKKQYMSLVIICKQSHTQHKLRQLEFHACARAFYSPNKLPPAPPHNHSFYCNLHYLIAFRFCGMFTKCNESFTTHTPQLVIEKHAPESEGVRWCCCPKSRRRFAEPHSHHSGVRNRIVSLATEETWHYVCSPVGARGFRATQCLVCHDNGTDSGKWGVSGNQQHQLRQQQKHPQPPERAHEPDTDIRYRTYSLLSAHWYNGCMVRHIWLRIVCVDWECDMFERFIYLNKQYKLQFAIDRVSKENDFDGYFHILNICNPFDFQNHQMILIVIRR